MHYIEEDIYGNDEKGNQILIAKGGTYFGGPFSIYDIKWEERPVNWLLRWWFKQKERKRSESSRDIMHEIARRETLQRAKAEEELKEARKQLDNYITEIAERTSREHQLIEERKKLQLDIRGQLHDIAHQFIDLRARTYVGLASVLWMAITDLPEEKISFLFNDASISPIPQTGDELVRRVKKTLSKDQVNEDQSVPIDVLKIRDLSEILLENTDGLRHEGLLRDFLSEANKIRDSCSSGDQYCRNLMNSFEAEPYQRLNLRELWDNASERIRGSSKGGLARFEYSASEDVFIEGDEKRLTLTLENLIANALKANRGVKTNPYVKVEMQREDTRVRYILQNSVAWKSEEEMQQVVIHANSLSNQRFSTDNPKGGLGMVYIKGTIRDHGGSYSASGDYEKGEFRQVIELPIIN
jgi:signal transduction histidine kinase